MFSRVLPVCFRFAAQLGCLHGCRKSCWGYPSSLAKMVHQHRLGGHNNAWRTGAGVWVGDFLTVDGSGLHALFHETNFPSS
jgi:hypothetical protein